MVWTRRDLPLTNSPVFSMISGGSRTVSRGEVVSLDAKRSFDPDSCATAANGTGSPAAVAADCAGVGLSGLLFTWECVLPCSAGPCRLSGSRMVVRMAAAAAVELDLSKLDLSAAATQVSFPVFLACSKMLAMPEAHTI